MLSRTPEFSAPSGPPWESVLLWLRSGSHSPRGVAVVGALGDKMGAGAFEGPLPSWHLFSPTLTCPGPQCFLPPASCLDDSSGPSILPFSLPPEGVS